MTVWLWVGFLAFVLVMLWLDLAVVNRRAHVVRVREALAWTGVCVGLALAFNVLVYFIYRHHWLGMGLDDAGAAVPHAGRTAAVQFFTGWLVEYSLSVDNIFVMVVIFQYFRIAPEHQHRVLFWGVLGALVMRGAMIGVGTAVIERFHWAIYVLAGFLLFSAGRMLFAGDESRDPERSWTLRLARRVLRVSPQPDGVRFLTRVDGRLKATPLLLVLVVVELTDVVFAVDSIPAIIGITSDPFLVFTSNVFAILGLRSLYFALAAFMKQFRYLKVALVFVLAFVAAKMIMGGLGIDISTGLSLGVIAGMLVAGVGASLLETRREQQRIRMPIDDLSDAADRLWRRSRRTVILVVGLTIVALSVPIGLLPGPGGIAVAVAGLALLATEFVWARNLLRTVKAKAEAISAHAASMVPKKPRLWLIPLVWAIAALIEVGIALAFPEHRRIFILASIGPAVVAAAWWSVMVYRRWRAARREAPGEGSKEG